VGLLEHFTYGDFEFIKKLDDQVDILCQHGRYRAKPLHSMLGETAKFITILRDPVEQFLSLWDFYNFSAVAKLSLQQWMNVHRLG